LEDTINPQTLKQMYNAYINTAHIKLLTPSELRKMEIEYTNYFSKYTNQKWGDLVNTLIKCYKSWDNYALSIIYLYIIRKTLSHIPINQTSYETQKQIQRKELLKRYAEILKETITSTPERRYSPEKTKQQLHALVTENTCQTPDL
jgi:hypothetical protein